MILSLPKITPIKNISISRCFGASVLTMSSQLQINLRALSALIRGGYRISESETKNKVRQPHSCEFWLTTQNEH